MNHAPPFLAQVVAMVVASALIAYVCHRLRILPIVGILLLLFTLGIEFSLERLRRIQRAIFVGGGLQLGLTIAASMGILALLGVEWRTGFYTGALVALSSTAIVLKVLGERS